jgi:23S rRNA pseudouridine1911/1915/1917 synthase
MNIKVKSEESNNRLDIFLSAYLNESRNLITKNIKNANILVNGKEVKAGYSLRENDEIYIDLKHEEKDIKSEDIKLDIYYEDEYLMVVNKPSGMVVHPAPGNYNHTLVNALINHTEKLSDVNGEFRPGIVHRIDKDTSGLLLISKDNKVHEILSKGFKEKDIKRKYIALVKGVITENKGKIEAPIGRSESDRKKLCVTEKNSKKAVTNFTVLERYKNATLIELELETGRTHQIRVHMSYIGHPVINDPLYNKDKIVDDYGQMLHAYYLGFNHPISGKFMEFTSPLEPKFTEIQNKFKNS